MMMKRTVLWIVMFTSLISVYAASIGEVWAAKDVIACRYFQRVTLMDVQTTAEVEVYSDPDLVEIVWDKSGKKLFMLSDIKTSAARYEDPDLHTLKLWEMPFPSATPVLLKTIPIKGELVNFQYSALYLGKDGNPVIVLYYASYTGINDEWQYVYNISTKQLGAPLHKPFVQGRDDFYPKGLPKITSEAGKYYSLEDNSTFNLYTKSPQGDDIKLTDVKSLNWFGSIKKEPLLYTVSPDSSRILFSIRDSGDYIFGATYSITKNGEKLQKLSDRLWLGDQYKPFWMSDNRLVYQIAKNNTNDSKYLLNILEINGDITTVKEWENQDYTPKIMYRFIGK